MKRTELKRKTPLRSYTGLKSYTTLKSKSPLRPTTTLKAKPSSAKKKQPSISSLKEKVWKECKRIIRARYGNTCYTSGQQGLEGSNWHTGHGVPQGTLPLRYQFDLRNLRPQSYNENINRGGNSHVFLAKLEREEEGLAFLQEVCHRTEEGYWKVKNYETMGGTDARIFLQNLIEEYKKL